MIVMTETIKDEMYVGPDGHTLGREEGYTLNGNHLQGAWVLRRYGEWVDFDTYRTDIAERHGLQLTS